LHALFLREIDGVATMDPSEFSWDVFEFGDDSEAIRKVCAETFSELGGEVPILPTEQQVLFVDLTSVAMHRTDDIDMADHRSEMFGFFGAESRRRDVEWPIRRLLDRVER
jgi:hypothetical protein